MRYIVAKANQTATCFVAKAEKERDDWIVIYRTVSYAEACARRDAENGSVRHA